MFHTEVRLEFNTFLCNVFVLASWLAHFATGTHIDKWQSPKHFPFCTVCIDVGSLFLTLIQLGVKRNRRFQCPTSYFITDSRSTSYFTSDFEIYHLYLFNALFILRMVDRAKI